MIAKHFRQKLESTEKILEPVPIVGFLTGVVNGDIPVLVQSSFSHLFIYIFIHIYIFSDYSEVDSVGMCRENCRASHRSTDSVHLYVGIIKQERFSNYASCSSSFVFIAKK